MSDKQHFFSANDDEERFTATTVKEAMTEYLDGCIQPWPKKVLVTEYEPDEIDAAQEARFLLSELIERLDEEYGDPDEETHITDTMKKLAADFVDAFLREYRVFRCGIVEVHSIDTEAWVRAEQPFPDWEEKLQEMMEGHNL